ncbi:GNAT family N-acetyltransferase [Anaerocolumna sp. MB42-C2]|uniref:GNAT family N-acetyltransferase n=1 Tax=Anaerocolumna sp. MB42-C2 TaxID=3070997 RepID=UPI0027E14F08|nr:hypothetical protein [Anaerocolumna sp. MB42-C2]WMJ87570.1 hypothetical protein RBU59_26640 [Anaerocolumna sp. MB42-C2]
MIIRTAIKSDIVDINKLFIELDADSVQYQTEHYQIGNRTDEYLLEIINNRTQLLDGSKKWAKEHGMGYLRLSVFPANDSGIRFYKRHGLMEQMVTMECSLT